MNGNNSKKEMREISSSPPPTDFSREKESLEKQERELRIMLVNPSSRCPHAQSTLESFEGGLLQNGRRVMGQEGRMPVKVIAGCWYKNSLDLLCPYIWSSVMPSSTG